MPNFKIYDVADLKTNSYNTQLPNISNIKTSQTMEFSPLVEYNIQKTFLEKSHKKCGGEALVPGPFIKFKSEHISELTVGNIVKFGFIVFTSQSLPKYNKTKALTTCFLPCTKLFFKKEKKGLEFFWNPCLIFCMIFEEKYFPRYIWLTGQILFPDCLYLL